MKHHIHSSPGAALQRIKRAISTYRLPSPRVRKASNRPYASGSLRQQASSSAQHLSTSTSGKHSDMAKIGYLMVCDKRQGDITYSIELCAVNLQGQVVRVDEDDTQVSVLFEIQRTARRLVSRVSRSQQAIEVIDMGTGKAIVYLQATSRGETKAWLIAMREVTDCDDSAKHPINPGSPMGSKNGWEVVDVGGNSCCSMKPPVPFLHHSPPKITLLLSKQSPKPPHLVQALIQALLPKPPCAVDPQSSSISRPLSFVRIMNDRLPSSPAVHVVMAGVVYLRMLDDDILCPTPHVLAPHCEWQPYMGVLAKCSDFVSLFLFDIDGTMVVEIAEIDIGKLTTQDIQVLDDSVFADTFGFSINLEAIVHEISSSSTEHVSSIRHSSVKSATASCNINKECNQSSSICFSDKQAADKLSLFDEASLKNSRHHSADVYACRRSRSLSHISGPNGLNSSRAASDGDRASIMQAESARTPQILYFSTHQACERNRWVSQLRQYAQSPLAPTDSMRINGLKSPSFRVERCLWIKMHQVHGLSQPANITAAILADGHLLARTDTATSSNGSLRLGGASYCFGKLNLIRRGVNVVVLQKKGTEYRVVGQCLIPISMLRRGHSYDGWYPLTYGGESLSPLLPFALDIKPARKRWLNTHRRKRAKSVKSSSDANMAAATGDALPLAEGDQPAAACEAAAPFRSGDIHIQLCYDETVVLRQPMYEDVVVLLLHTDPTLIFRLASMHPNSADWLIETVTKIAISLNSAESWIECLVCHELEMRAERDPALLFRGTSVATRAVDTLMKVVGLEFVDRLIGDVVRDIISNEYACEVDPARLPDSNNIDVHWEALNRLLQMLWQGIEDGAYTCPSILRKTFACIRSSTTLFYGNRVPHSQVQYSCISGFVFLRLLCPAMLSPKAFGLISQTPSALSLRTLTLLAKGIQCAANLSDFSCKEPYMQPMDGFVQHCIPRLKAFIDSIAVELPLVENLDKPETWGIDGEYELAVFCAFIYSSRSHIREELAAQCCLETPGPTTGVCTSMPASPIVPSDSQFGLNISGPPSQGIGLNINSGSSQLRQLSDTYAWPKRKAGHIDTAQTELQTTPSLSDTLTSSTLAKPTANESAFAKHFGSPLDFIACSSVELLVRECEAVQSYVNICIESSPELTAHISAPDDEPL
ncbi:Ras GTPase-activating protein 1 [Coemansia brasiliensis]|uniref:Ras GTPase-activating protein 1 n=1 Tax=Coemansia brasiliensis TaxID=2650707 RepID=A0A9W8LZG8_9FUNG|nr:Ras GTPase-activating protein 1 [Coemansia brasiliensis]